MNSRTEAFLAEAKRLSLSPEERTEVRHVLAAHQAASGNLNLNPAEKALFRRKLKEAMHSRPEPWWQFLLQLPQLSLPVAGLAVFLLVFATGSITSLRWLTDDSTMRAPVEPADLGAPDTQHMVPDDFLQMPDKKSDQKIRPLQNPTKAIKPMPQAPALNESENAPAEPMMLYRAGGEEVQAGEAVPAMETLDAAGQAIPAIEALDPAGPAEPMMMKAMPMMQEADMPQAPEDRSRMRLMKGGCGTLLPSVTDSGSSLGDTVSPLLQPEQASGALLP